MAVRPQVFAGSLGNDERLREALLAYARRHDFDITGAAVPVPSEGGDPESAREWLAEAADQGVHVMLNNGRVNHPGRELVDGRLDEALADLRAVVEVYADYYPEGHVFAFHESPLFAEWEGKMLADQAESMVEYGPDIFAAMKETVEEVAPGVDLGAFVHHPFLPGPEHTDYPAYTEFVERCRERGAAPDFTYCDMYRGYYEWEAGYEGTNDYLRGIVSNVKDVTGQPVYYLGEAHTIMTRYTPSRQAMQGNLRAAVEAGADGYGWWANGSFQPTHERSYNPMLPDERAGEGEGSGWISGRDRLAWAKLLLVEQLGGVAPADRFDLWVYGHDMDLYEVGVELRVEGEWRSAGGVTRYPSGPTVYDPTDRNWLAALHSFDRSWLAGDLDVRLTARDGSGGADIRGVYAVPCPGVAHYRTEPDLTAMIAGGDLDPEAVALGGRDLRVGIPEGERRELALDIGAPDRRVEDTTLAVESPDRGRLADLERGMDLRAGDYRERFDLWLFGSGLGDTRLFLQDSGYELSETEVTDRADTDGRALVVRGLEKDAFYNRHSAGSFVWPRLSGGADLDVWGAYLMPYHGTANLKPPGEVARIVAEEYTERRGQIETFALGSASAPLPAPGGEFETWIHVDDRRVFEREPFDYHPSGEWPTPHIDW